MNKVFLLSLSIALLMSVQSVSAFAGIDAGSINSSDVMDFRIREALSHTKDKNIIPKVNKEINNENITEVNQVTSTSINDINFVNNVSVSSSELHKVVEDYINKPMNPQNVNAIRKEIMKYYQKRGYYSAVAMVSSQDVQRGNLVFDIQEGGRNSIVIQP